MTTKALEDNIKLIEPNGKARFNQDGAARRAIFRAFTDRTSVEPPRDGRDAKTVLVEMGREMKSSHEVCCR